MMKKREKKAFDLENISFRKHQGSQKVILKKNIRNATGICPLEHIRDSRKIMKTQRWKMSKMHTKNAETKTRRVPRVIPLFCKKDSNINICFHYGTRLTICVTPNYGGGGVQTIFIFIMKMENQLEYLTVIKFYLL